MKSLAIILPVYNDWLSFGHMVKLIDDQDFVRKIQTTIYVVDDASSQGKISLPVISNIKSIELVSMAFNLGHQRAIASGLCQAFSANKYDIYMCADSDGEDAPQDFEKLISAHNAADESIVVAQRAQRSEGIKFQLLYFFYKKLFQWLTGKNINFGNFMLIPNSQMRRIVCLPQVWNHLAGAVLKSEIKIQRVPVDRSKRIIGASKMNTTSLVMHGLSAISVFIDIVLVRILIVLSLVGVLTFGLSLIIIAIRFMTNWAIPGWATSGLGFSVVIFLQSATFAAITIFNMLSNRSQHSEPPLSFYKKYITQTYKIY
jgi:hypothetical protein